jgi:hypothetical protein
MYTRIKGYCSLNFVILVLFMQQAHLQFPMPSWKVIRPLYQSYAEIELAITQQHLSQPLNVTGYFRGKRYGFIAYVTLYSFHV